MYENAMCLYVLRLHLGETSTDEREHTVVIVC